MGDISLAGEFEGLVLSGKNAGRDHEDDYLSLNKTTGKKKGRGKKKGGLEINEKIMLVPETIEMFALLELEPPSTINGVSDTVKKLQEKKTWFCTLPRGKVPSLREKQRADEAKQKTSRRDHGDFNEKSCAPTSKTSVRGIKVKGFNAADLSAVDDAFPSSLVHTLKRTPEQPSNPRCLIEPCCCVKGWVYIWRKDQPQLNLRALGSLSSNSPVFLCS